MPIDNIFPTRRRLLGTGGALALTGLLPSLASAQAAWPSKSVRFVVPFAPGGSSDSGVSSRSASSGRASSVRTVDGMTMYILSKGEASTVQRGDAASARPAYP